MKIKNAAFIAIAVLLAIGLVDQLAALTAKTTPQKATIPESIDAKDLAIESDAPVVIVEYSDFQCPYCARVVPTVHNIKESYGDDIDIVFRHFPLDFHQNAQKAAEAAECARDQRRFWEYHDALFEHQNALTVKNLKRYAANLGLDTNRFNTCLDSGEKEALVKAHFAQGQSRGVRGTPTFFINDQMVVGAQQYEAFAQVIDVMLDVAGEQ